MKTKKHSEMTVEGLQKSEKTIKAMTIALSVMLLFLFIVNIVMAFKNGFSALFVVPIALLPIVIININNLKEIKKELNSRNI